MTHDADYLCMEWLRGLAQAHASLLLPDLSTHAHQIAVTELSIPFALQLDYSPHDAQVIEIACITHDIGKIAILPEIYEYRHTVLDRTSNIFALIKKHTDYGARFFNALMASVGHEHLMDALISSCKFHHEHWDGSGYLGLRGNTIPKIARLIGILDAYSAMTDPFRAYRKMLTQEQAIAELQACAGTQFDPNMIVVMLEMLQKSAHRGSLRPD